MFDFRGYGKSEGSPSLDGFYRDAVAILKFARSHEMINKDNIYLFGKAIGANIAVKLAVNQPKDVLGVILEQAYTSLKDLVDNISPKISPFIRILFKDKCPMIDQI